METFRQRTVQNQDVPQAVRKRKGGRQLAPAACRQDDAAVVRVQEHACTAGTRLTETRSTCSTGLLRAGLVSAAAAARTRAAVTTRHSGCDDNHLCILQVPLNPRL